MSSPGSDDGNGDATSDRDSTRSIVDAADVHVPENVEVPDPAANVQPPDPVERVLPDLPDSMVPENPSNPDAVRLFWRLVVVFDVAILAIALGALLLYFEGQFVQGGGFLGLGFLSFGYGVARYRRYRRQEDETDSADADDEHNA